MMFFVARASLSAKNHLSNDLSHFHLYFFCKRSIYLKPTLYQTQSMLATFFSIYFLNFYMYMMFQFFHGWISSGNKRIKVMVARTGGGGLIIALLLWRVWESSFHLYCTYKDNMQPFDRFLQGLSKTLKNITGAILRTIINHCLCFAYLESTTGT